MLNNIHTGRALIGVSLALIITGCGGSSSMSVTDPVVPEQPTSPEPPSEPSGFSINILETALEGTVVHEVRPLTSMASAGQVVATTNTGIYLKEGERWGLISPDSWEVIDFYELNGEQWYASIRDNGITRLAESVDGGERWGFVANNFGGSAELSDATQEPVYRMTADETGQRLFAVGVGVLAESLDFGSTWQAISGFWGSFGSGLDSLTYIPSSPLEGATKTLFYGGQGAIENPILNRFDVMESGDASYSVGEETLMDVSAEELLPVPSVIKSIVPLAPETGSYLVTGEGGIIITRDNGNNWQATLTNQDSRFYFDVLVHPDDRQFWVTAGWDKNFDTPQPLIVELTRDGGQTWEAVTWSGEDEQGIFGGAYSMSWANPAENTVYFGTVNGGIYTVQLQL